MTQTTMVLAAAGAGFILGAAMTWLWERSRQAELAARLEQSHGGQEEQRRLLEEATLKLGTAFKDLASSALSANAKNFLELAQENLGRHQERAKGELESRRQAVEALVKPLQETLERFRGELGQIERARQEAYGALKTQLSGLASTHEKLEQETGQLVTALRRPEVRGQWGEVQLRNAVELAGMSPYCDFIEQKSIDTAEGRLRPDMLVRLPNGRQVVVDSKVPLDAYLSALETPDGPARQESLRRHAQQLRRHMEQLGQKAYWDQFPEAPELVVLFLHSESPISAALEQDRTLLEDALARKVLIATPVTLVGLLRAVAYGWREVRMAENARRIGELGRDLYDRMSVLSGHLVDLRKHLVAQLESFNAAVGSFESRVLPSARKLKELGVSSEKEIPTLEPVDESPRPLREG